MSQRPRVHDDEPTPSVYEISPREAFRNRIALTLVIAFLLGLDVIILWGSEISERVAFIAGAATSPLIAWAILLILAEWQMVRSQARAETR